MNPEDFARTFATTFAAHDAIAMSALLSQDATTMTLTGQIAEGIEAARLAMSAEFLGIFARARLVSGKGTLRQLCAQITLLTQRYVVTGAVDETGSEQPRFAALLVAVLQEDSGDWRAISLTFSAAA